MSLYCVECGELYPEGELSRPLWPYDGAHYADDKCPGCQEKDLAYTTRTGATTKKENL